MQIYLSTFIPIFTATFAILAINSLAGLSLDELDAFACESGFAEVGVSAFGGVESYRGIPNGDANDNFGIHFGFEFASPLPKLKEFGFGTQFGASYGAYNFAGNRQSYQNSRNIQNQEFVSLGLFVLPLPELPLSMGIMYDWMFNQNFGLYVHNVSLEQVRGQIAYFVRSADELGVWATYDTTVSRKHHRFRRLGYQVVYRAIAQANLFWRHFFCNGADSTIWIGTPLRHRLNRNHSDRPGKYIIGAELNVPFFDHWVVSGKACYMQPGCKSGREGAREYVSDITFNLTYYYGGTPTEGKNNAWIPYMPMGNNSNFFVDAKTKYTHRKKPVPFPF